MKAALKQWFIDDSSSLDGDENFFTLKAFLKQFNVSYLQRNDDPVSVQGCSWEKFIS